VCLFAFGCGGGAKPKQTLPDDPIDDGGGEEVEPEEEELPPEPPPPPPPQVWAAHVDLAPVKGSKLKAAVVSFSQTEGETAQIMTEGFPGLKAGKYHLVIHESGECGKNAAKAGAAWDVAAGVALDVTVAKGEPGAFDQPLELMLDGDDSIIGHTLVMHADKKGKADKAIGCGVIVADEVADEATDEGSDDEMSEE
jgi:hypothetical protein